MWVPTVIAVAAVAVTAAVAAITLDTRRYRQACAARHARGMAVLVPAGVVEPGDAPWGEDLDHAVALADAIDAGKDRGNLIGTCGAARFGTLGSEYDELAARHGVDELGCVTFCGATLVPVLGGGPTPLPDGFVDRDSGEADAIWAEYERYMGNLEKLRSAADKFIDHEVARRERGEFPSDAALRVAIPGFRFPRST